MPSHQAVTGMQEASAAYTISVCTSQIYINAKWTSVKDVLKRSDQTQYRQQFHRFSNFSIHIPEMWRQRTVTYRDLIDNNIVKPPPSLCYGVSVSHWQEPFIIFIVVIWTLNLVVTYAVVIHRWVIRLGTASTDQVTTILHQPIDQPMKTCLHYSTICSQ